MKLIFKLNGKPMELEVSGGERVLDLLRERLDLVGTKEGCGKGECGACTVLLDGAPVCSCLLLSSQAAGREIVTIEGLSAAGKLHPVQEAFADVGAVQCGFCTPGEVLSAVALLRRHPRPSREEIKRGLSGNLCRCTGYEKILAAVELAAESMAKDSRRRNSDARRSGRMRSRLLEQRRARRVPKGRLQRDG
jgi:carbon-monoxide dehydrogenase small subunit